MECDSRSRSFRRFGRFRPQSLFAGVEIDSRRYGTHPSIAQYGREVSDRSVTGVEKVREGQGCGLIWADRLEASRRSTRREQKPHSKYRLETPRWQGGGSTVFEESPRSPHESRTSVGLLFSHGACEKKG